MGTLCKNCPLKNIHKETGENCTIAFVQRYKNSCVSYDLAEHQFEKELNKMSKEKKEKLDQLEKDIANYQEKKKSTSKKPRSNKKAKKDTNGVVEQKLEVEERVTVCP